MEMKGKRSLSADRLPWLMLLLSLAGFSMFYLIPFLLSFVYSMIDNPIHREFTGIQNYVNLFRNVYFMRGLKNTCIFMAISIPLNMLLSLGAAMAIKNMRHYPGFFSLLFLIPLAIPSATSAFFWESFFGLHGTLNRFLFMLHIEGIDWLNGDYGMAVMVVIFIWKNIGYDMTLFLSGLSGIPEQYYEYADVEGAGKWWKFKNVTLTYLTPTLFLTLIMTFVNSFKVFKEIYIITGEYPPDSLYVLQHFMNNMFLSLNYSKLVSAVYILTVVIVLLVSCIFKIERTLSKDLHY